MTACPHTEQKPSLFELTEQSGGFEDRLQYVKDGNSHSDSGFHSSDSTIWLLYPALSLVLL